MIVIIGEFDSSFAPHPATSAALQHAARRLQIDVEYRWVSTLDITPTLIDDADGIWVAPGSPYRSMTKTLELIQAARTRGLPCLGTCGGFQHMVIEFARNVLGIQDAQHAEYDPYASQLIVSKLACSLAGRDLQIEFLRESKVAESYQSLCATESYYCNFGVNPDFAQAISDAGFRIVGTDSEGEARVMEITEHPFFVGTLFVPQTRSTPDNPHPLVTAFLRAVTQVP